jgi:hypothetical protein
MKACGTPRRGVCRGVPLMDNSRELSKISDFAEKIAVGVDHDNPIAFQRKSFLASFHYNSKIFVSWSTIF